MSDLELNDTPQAEDVPDAAFHVTVENVGGDLKLRGWGDPEAIAAEGDGVHQDEDANGFPVVISSGDLKLRVPQEADISGENVGGDARIIEVYGAVSLENIGADLVLRDTGAANIMKIGGDLRIKRAGGDVRIDQIGGDATIREVDGQVLLTQVGGDLYVRDVIGPCVAEQVGADLVLSTDFAPEVEYRFRVGGDIVCRVPAGADVRFRVLDCAELEIDAPAAEMVEGEDGDEVVFGSGAALVELRAGGDVQLVGQDEDYMMAINIQLEDELAARLDGIEEKLAEQLSGLDEMLLEKTERLRNKAERQAERALRKTEKALRKIDRGSSGKRKSRSFSFSFGGPGGSKTKRQPTPEPDDPVSDQERLTILRMVEAGQISVEEAERLLAALEGR